MTSDTDNYGTARASSTCGPEANVPDGYKAYRAFSDLSIGIGWYPNNTPKSGDWVEYISNSEIKFDRIKFRHNGANGYSMTVGISISQDGSQYTNIGSIGPVSMNVIASKTFSELYNAKYIKFTLQNGYSAFHGNGFQFSIEKVRPVSAYKITATPVS